MASMRRSLKYLPTHVSARRRDQDVLLDDQEKKGAIVAAARFDVVGKGSRP